MKKLISLALVLYLLASCLFSIVHAGVDNPWEFRESRNGLLCMEFIQHDEYGDEWEFVVYSPFTNYADVFLFGVQQELAEDGHTELYTYSDGFDCFGQW